MTYQLSLKVEREYIVASPATDDEIPMFTEGRKNIKIIDVPANDLPTYTEGRKRIYHSLAVH